MRPTPRSTPALRRAACAAAALATGLLSACGAGDRGAAGADATRATGLPVADPAGRMVVARVNDQPVYDDCVAIQAAALGLPRDDALDQCVAFELLAQRAAERGYASHPAVVEARERESVRRLIDRAFASEFADPETVNEGLMRAAFQRYRRRFYRPEYRYAEYVRAPAPEKQAPPGSDPDRAARALADEIHAALSGRRGLSSEEFHRVAAGVAGDRPLDHSPKPFDFPRKGRAVESFAAAAFALPEPGVVSPPTRTRWGWDVILLTRILPEKNVLFEQARHELFEGVRAEAFRGWLARLTRGARVDIDEDALAQLARARALTEAGQ